MGSNSKKKTTMAKLNRERKLVERRHHKQAKKAARKLAAAQEAAMPSGEALIEAGPDAEVQGDETQAGAMQADESPSAEALTRSD